MKKPLRCYLGGHVWIQASEDHIHPRNPHVVQWHKFIMYCALCRKVRVKLFYAYDEKGRSMDEISMKACGVTPPETLEEWVAGTTQVPR